MGRIKNSLQRKSPDDDLFLLKSVEEKKEPKKSPPTVFDLSIKIHGLEAEKSTLETNIGQLKS